MYTTESQFVLKTDCGKEVEVRIVRYDSGTRSMLVSDYNYIINMDLQTCVEVGVDVRPEHLKAKIYGDKFVFVGLVQYTPMVTKYVNEFISTKIKLVETGNALAQVAKQYLA